MKNPSELANKLTISFEVFNPLLIAFTSFILCFTLLCLLSCKKQDPSTVTNTETASLSLKVNEQKTLTVGQASKKNITLKFLGVKEERCPREECSLCYGGYVFARFNVIINDQPQDTLTLQRISCIPAEDINPDSQTVSKQQVGGLTITMINITELTKANSVNANDYVVKLLISTP